MKKFKFSLESVYDMKINIQKDIKLALQNVDKRIEQICAEEIMLDQSIAKERAKFEEDCKKGTNAMTLRMYNNFFSQGDDKKRNLQKQLEILRAQRQLKQSQLIVNMNELKVLDEKRELQLKAYHAEVQQKENKEMDSYVSHKACTM